jgi:hypothetical protein
VAVERAGRSMRAARLSFLALVLYVAADFANPLMPGAVCFDPNESVDGVARARSSTIVPPVLSGAPGPATPLPAPPPVTAPSFIACPAAGAAATPPRARAALPLVSDRSSDDA